MPSSKVATTRPDTIQIEYETFGKRDDPALLLVAGFADQLTSWPAEFCELLASTGRYVIRFDNRDCGLSTKLDGAVASPQATLAALLSGGEMPEVPYTLSDMANDGIGLLGALGIERAHVAGCSMGGMIAQTMAIGHPDRVLSLTSIMSSTGNPRVGKPTPAALEVLLATPPPERAAFQEASARCIVWGSKRYGDADLLRQRAGEAFDRSFYPEGGPRQLAAMYASGDRSERLAASTVPTLVIHGRDDTLIGVDGASATAEAVPGAHLLLLADMGHDLPRPLWPVIVGAMNGLADALTYPAAGSGR